MSEIQSSDFSETAANNNAAAPNGWPEGQLGSSVNNAARELMAAIKRDWNRSHVTISSTGSANAYVLTYSNAPTLTHGMIFSFKANFANTGTATANVNALGAITITRSDGATPLLTGDILANQHVVLSYDSALNRMVLLSPPSALVSQSEGAAVASAGTTNIWADAGGTLHITGTTTITSFGTAPYAGAWKRVIFDDALTLTHAANLSLPGSANITTAADDMAFVYADTTTQFDVIYFKKSGASVATTSVGDQAVVVHTGNGHGSTNTKIRRFTTAMTEVGTAITYADSAANGASFTINETGLYSINYAESHGAAYYHGVSVNSTQLTTDIYSITVANRLLMRNAGGAFEGSVSITERFIAGDVIRAHNGTTLPTVTSDAVKFSIRKVGS